MRNCFVSLCLAAAVGSAGAVQLVLSPSNVIGASGSYGANFQADNILDQQTGTATDVSGNYWLNPDNTGAASVFITVDLGAAYTLEFIQLFNTHNGPWVDRGTGNFTILGANAVTDLGGGNFRVSGTTATLVSGTLSALYGGDPPAVTFDVTDTGAYRYLSFQPTSVASAITPPSSTAYGLNEMRVFITAVPEPATWMTWLAGLAALGGWALRRAPRPGSPASGAVSA